LKTLIGHEVIALRRVHYVHEGTATTEHGPIELTFDNNQSVWLDAGADGELLELHPGHWVDPFVGRLDQENLDFIARSGRWIAFDADRQHELAPALGETLGGVEAVFLPGGEIVGIVLTVGERTLRIETESADEVFVSLA
jgi:hypothetical protein